MASERLQLQHSAHPLVREDLLSVDYSFTQFVDSYIVLREFLMEMSCVIYTRGAKQLSV